MACKAEDACYLDLHSKSPPAPGLGQSRCAGSLLFQLLFQLEGVLGCGMSSKFFLQFL